MQAGRLCVLVHVWAGVGLAGRETGFSLPVKYFTDRSKAVLLLCIICIIYVLRLCLDPHLNKG